MKLNFSEEEGGIHTLRERVALGILPQPPVRQTHPSSLRVERDHAVPGFGGRPVVRSMNSLEEVAGAVVGEAVEESPGVVQRPARKASRAAS